MNRISLRMIALSMAGALVLSLGAGGVGSAFAQTRGLSPGQDHIKGSNEELVAMLNTIRPETLVDCSDIIITADQLKEIGAEAETITQGITDDYEKVVAIEKFVYKRITYSTDVADQNAYTAFKEQKGICQAYSNLTKAMLSYLGIPCILVNGNSTYGGHAWNMAYTKDRGWFFVDSTWDAVYTNIDEFSESHQPYYCDSILEAEGDYVFTYHNGVAVSRYTGKDTTLDIPDDFRGVPTTALDEDMRNWGNADTFTSISFPATLKNIDQVDYAFTNYTNLKEFQVAEGNPSFTSEDGVLYNSGKTQLLVYPAAKTDISFQVPDTVTSFAECVFQYNANLKYILIPTSVTNMGKKNLFHDNTVTVYASAGSAAATYAQQNNLTLKDPDAFPTHIHNLTAVPGKASTCTVKGNIPYWYCKECDKYFSDAEAKTEISKEKTELPLAQHKTQLQNQKDATCTEEGYTGNLECTECKTVVEKGKTIPAKGHNYENGVCTVCGAEDPNYVVPTTPVEPTPSPDVTNTPEATASPVVSQAPSTPAATSAPSTNVPPTGDTSSLLLWMSVIALAGSGMLALLAIRRSR